MTIQEADPVMQLNPTWRSFGFLKPGVVVHTCNPSPREAEGGRSQVRGQEYIYSHCFRSVLGYTCFTSIPLEGGICPGTFPTWNVFIGSCKTRQSG